MKILTALSGTPGTATFGQPAQQTTILEATNVKFARNVVLSNSGVRVIKGSTQAGISIHELIVVLVGQEPALTWAPIISVQPVAASCVHSSTAATFSVTAASETDIAQAYQWQHNNAGTLTYDNVSGPSDGDTVVIGIKTYTFKTTLTPTEGQVLLNGGGDAALLNLIRAINHTGTPDTDYKCAAANTQVTAATAVVAHSIAITAIVGGSNIATTTTASHLSWASATTNGWASASGTVNGCAYTNGTTATLTCTPTTTGQTGFLHRCLLTSAGGSTANQTASDSVTLTIT